MIRDTDYLRGSPSLGGLELWAVNWRSPPTLARRREVLMKTVETVRRVTMSELSGPTRVGQWHLRQR